LAYSVFALSPTQYTFIAVSDFYVSPADVLVLAAAFGLVLRLAAMEHRSWNAVRQHRFMILLIVSYCLGFIVLGVFSRTLVRVAMALVPSLIACELLRTRNQLRRALTALIVAGALDAAYGMFFIARGSPLYPGRFAGMTGVNFSAMTIIPAAVIALALAARSARAAALWRPTAFAGVGLSTLSLGGALGLVAAWLGVLRRVVNRSNKRRLAVGLTLCGVVVFSFSAARERILNREARQVMADGVARNSLDVRWAIIEAAGRAFEESPVFGIGYSSFIEYSRTDAEVYAGSGGEGHATHNTYLEVLVEGGLIAFGLFALHWLQYGRRSRLVIRALKERDLVAAACFGAFGVEMVGAAFANVLLSYHYWSVCGLALAYLNVRIRELQGSGATIDAAAVR
jgi:O-antigen ligase